MVLVVECLEEVEFRKIRSYVSDVDLYVFFSSGTVEQQIVLEKL